MKKFIIALSFVSLAACFNKANADELLSTLEKILKENFMS